MSLLAADDAGPQTGKRNADHFTREGIWIDTDGQVGEDFQMIRMSALASRLKRRLLPVDRPPDQLVGDPDAPYIFRWRLWPKNPLINAYLHNVVRADDEAALHDHPWPSVSIMLAGTIDETFAARKGEKVRKLRAGDVVLRKSRFAHRLSPVLTEPAWTLFITGPRVREWGFHCAQGWRDWKTFVEARKGGKYNGCDDP